MQERLTANKPGSSTHERRSDAVAYAGPIGRPLPYWCVGMDWSDPGAVVRAARTEGFVAKITYPGNPREGHHINFSRQPRTGLLFQTLKRGSTGRGVVALTRRLSYVLSPVDRKPYLDGKRSTFDAETEAALKRFQREHHQVEDGIYGPSSHRQLQTSVRWRKRHGGKDGR